MADFLIVGGLALEVEATGAAESAPELVGAHTRSAYGRNGGWVRAEIPTRTFAAAELTQGQWDALRATTPIGRAVSCSGPALGAPGLYYVTREAAVSWEVAPQPNDDAGLARYTVTLTLRKATP